MTDTTELEARLKKAAEARVYVFDGLLKSGWKRNEPPKVEIYAHDIMSLLSALAETRRERDEALSLLGPYIKPPDETGDMKTYEQFAAEIGMPTRAALTARAEAAEARADALQREVEFLKYCGA